MMDRGNNKTQAAQKDRLSRKSVNANLEGTVESKDIRVDFKPNELPLTEHPIRPDKWKLRRKFVGRLTIQLNWPAEVETDRPLKVTLVRVHKPYKADRPHIESTCILNKVDRAVELDEIAEGDYAIIYETQGYRPFGGLIEFREDNTSIKLSPLLRPVSNPEQEHELFRLGERHPYIIQIRGFLMRFGYLKLDVCNCKQDELCEHVGRALHLFQRTYKLLPLGTLTVESFLLMQRPRCAYPDLPLDAPIESSAGPIGIEEKDPIVFMGERWDTFDLRYALLTGTTDITNEWSIIRGALNTWANVSPLTFKETSDTTQSDLEFDFRRPSETGYPFDRGGSKALNILAHAWGPTNGLVEFDDYEDWGSTHLDAVATHEIGHALGLDHSSVEDSTMYALYDSGQASLHEVDVRGIKSLYAPVHHDNGPFIRYPLFAFNSKKGTDSVTIDLGQTRHFLAWGIITMIDTLVDFDRDNMCFIDVYEVDGNRTGWRVGGGDHFGSGSSPGNAHEGAYVGYGQRITFRITAGHTTDLEIAGYAIVLVLD